MTNIISAKTLGRSLTNFSKRHKNRKKENEKVNREVYGRNMTP